MGRAAVGLTVLLTFLTCLPDAMIPPVLDGLIVDRLGVTPSAAHGFMAAGLVGAVLGVGALLLLRRIFGSVAILVIGAVANAILLTALSLPIGFEWSLLLRVVEGAADMMVLAVLFDLLAREGRPERRGRRLGLGGTALMLGLAVGAIVGGRLGEIDPILVLQVGAAACVGVAVVAIGGRRLLRRFERLPRWNQMPDRVERRRPLWPVMAMFTTDRALGGLMATTVPLLFAGVAELSTTTIGVMVGGPILIMALGSWPAGMLGDKVGNLQLRVVAALVYAITVSLVPMLVGAPTWILIVNMLVLGIAASALLPTSLTLAARSGRGSVAMGACQAAGNIGYLIGIVGAGGLLALLGGITPGPGAYTMTVQIFALVHVATTGVTLAALVAPDAASIPGTPASQGA